MSPLLWLEVTDFRWGQDAICSLCAWLQPQLTQTKRLSQRGILEARKTHWRTHIKCHKPFAEECHHFFELLLIERVIGNRPSLLLSAGVSMDMPTPWTGGFNPITPKSHTLGMFPLLLIFSFVHHAHM